MPKVAHTTPHLRHLKEFQEALKHYKMSSEAEKVLHETPFVAMVAPTSSGRNTIINELLKTGEYHFIISDTTRPPRMNDGVMERDGVEYFFRTESEMLNDIKAGHFIEAEVIHRQQVSGISIREIQEAKLHEKIAITDVDIIGGETIARLKPDGVIFVVAPSFDEWLRRIYQRTSVEPIELHRRMQTATRMFKLVLTTDLFTPVVNDKLEDVVHVVNDLAHGKRHPIIEARARKAVEEQYEKAVEYLHHHAPEFEPA